MLDRVISLVLIGISALTLIASLQLAAGSGGFKGAALPLGLSISLGLLAAALFVQTLRAAPAGKAAAAALPASNPKTAVIVGVLVLFTVLMKPAGFLVAATVSGALTMRLAFKEPWWKAALIAAFMSALGWLLFKVLLGVLLPTGTLWQGVLG